MADYIDSDESGWLPMFIAAGVIMGIAMVPIWTIAYSEVEDQSTPDQGAINCATFNGSFFKKSISCDFLEIFLAFILENFPLLSFFRNLLEISILPFSFTIFS